MPYALFNLGFRVFFLLAALYSVLAMALWIGPRFLSQTLWHAHEMVFGYAMAVVAGFLLTAVRNWTGQKTPHGLPLALLAACWLAARLLMGFESTQAMGAFLDLFFQAGLFIAIARPIRAVRQWRQLPALMSVLGVMAGQVVFLAGLLGSRQSLALNGTLLGFYALIGLMLIITGRIVPFFTRSGLGLTEAPEPVAWVERLLLPLFAVFVLFAVLDTNHVITRGLAVALALLNGIRLRYWYQPGIIRKPLLWVLDLAYAWLVIGFGLLGTGQFQLGLHALAAGGLGGLTLGMMSRVSLGHTGRSIHRPPMIVGWLFGLVFVAAALRVLMPLLWPEYSLLWYRLAGASWILAFSGFALVYAPMLIQPRADGKPG